MPNSILTENYRKSELSYAYLHALASMCGYTCQPGPNADVKSIDAIVESESSSLHIQLKATSSPDVKKDGLHFKLKRKNYDDIRCSFTPTILVVLELPKEQEDWLQCDADRLVMRRCAWWKSLKGFPQIKTNTKVVTIPESQKLNPRKLRHIMELARRRAV